MIPIQSCLSSKPTSLNSWLCYSCILLHLPPNSSSVLCFVLRKNLSQVGRSSSSILFRNWIFVCNCEVNNQVFLSLSLVMYVLIRITTGFAWGNGMKKFQFNGEQQSGVSQKFQSIHVLIRWQYITIGYGSDRWNKVLKSTTDTLHQKQIDKAVIRSRPCRMTTSFQTLCWN